MTYDEVNSCYVEPCRFCGDAVRLYDGVRTYDPEGFPYVHVCPPAVIRVPNERDFTGIEKRPKPKAKPAEKPVRVSRVKVHGGVNL